MERIQKAMELALAAHWGEPVVAAPAVSLPTQRAAPPFVCRARVDRGLTSASTFAPSASDRIGTARAADPRQEIYLRLQAAVRDRMASRAIRVLGVTAPRGTRGKTLLAANLAVGMALHSDQPVTLIDLDLGQPSMHRLLALDGAAGVEDCLLDDSLLPNAISSSGIPGLAVLPARGSGAHLLEDMRPRFRPLLDRVTALQPEAVIVANLPEVAKRGEARLLAALVDGVVLVTEAHVTKERDLGLALAGIGQSKLLGTVLYGSNPPR